ncbi:restriction endonuclease subunit S [Ligilactobacillus salivarius]|uniref:Type I restriction modification DNA specificity domain-containing protein n=1 Tax=Ligilactobacillus salivarius TaxID=1624 RepID=A0A1V9QTB1_9LACO|nr:restriction endonuclease subunit S [Ligilactobacillus salivarius]OQQ84000.1 hypothetical protein B6U60_04660 [Ligilactobacillus salivarius]OQQ86663.1 hypothetical protein B6U59_04725 [Ligilactobacillus salivarius]
MAKEEKKAPKLRFNGYTNDWEQQELGAVVEFYSGLTYKPENVVQNGTLVIRSSNIHNNQYINADNVYVKNNIVNSEYVQEQDIVVVVRNGSRNLIGKHALLKSIPHDPSVIGAFMTGIRSLNNQFIEAVLNTEKFKREINKNLGATINQITTSQFKKMKFNFPKREEDKQIGILFNYLDDTIQLHERKCEELTLIKKALLQKLFPKKDKDRPEVRYKNFSDAWEQRKLGEMVEKSTIKNSDLEYSKEDILSVATMSDMSFSRDINSTENYMKTYNKILYGEIAFEGHSNKKYRFGRFVLNDYRNGIVSHIYDIYKIIIDYDMNFMKEWISLDRVMYKPLVNSTTSARMMNSLQAKKLYKQKVLLPDLQEQKEIGNFLNKFDTLIALHQRKLEKLKQLKKFLLQNMFI